MAAALVGSACSSDPGTQAAAGSSAGGESSSSGIGAAGAGGGPQSTSVGGAQSTSLGGVGATFVFATRTDGSVWSWGRNKAGNLGNGKLGDATHDNVSPDDENVSRPAQVFPPFP